MMTYFDTFNSTHFTQLELLILFTLSKNYSDLSFLVVVNLLHLQLVIQCAMSSLTRYSVEDILQVLIVFAVESLELDFALLFPERHILLRVLPILVVLATSSEKDSESLYKRVKINRLINIFKVIYSCNDFQSSEIKKLYALLPKGFYLLLCYLSSRMIQ